MEQGGHKVLFTERNRVSTPPLHIRPKKENVLPLNDSNPASPLSVAGTEPDIVGIGEAYFEAAMGSQATRIFEFPLQPIAQFT